MRRSVFILCVAAALALAGTLTITLAQRWLTREGTLEDLRWQPPPPVWPTLPAAPAHANAPPELPRFVAVVERPLFTPFRRPPQPMPVAPVVAAPPPPPPPPAPPDIRLMAVYGAGEDARFVASVNGRTVRGKAGDAFEGWTVRSLSPKGLEVARGDDVRKIELRRVIAAAPVPASSAATPPPVRTTPPTALTPSRDAEIARENVRRMNALRARAGLPPLPES